MSAQGWGVPSQPAAWAAPQVWSAPTHPGPKTNLLSVLAMAAAAAGATVIIGLGSIAAIVLGAIALGQIRRTGDDGRVLAVSAIVLGAVTLVALVVATVLAVSALVAFAQQVQGIAYP